MSVTKEQVIEFIAGLSVLELSELVKEFEEKTEFDVILASSGEKKINVIKVLRELTGLGLAEAKKASEETPFTVKTGIAKAEADEIKAKLEEVGAKVEVK